jgi:hypothetical protein
LIVARIHVNVCFRVRARPFRPSDAQVTQEISFHEYWGLCLTVWIRPEGD